MISGILVLILQVVSNGFFSFGSRKVHFEPLIFPGPDTSSNYTYMVAPFWADHDIRYVSDKILEACSTKIVICCRGLLVQLARLTISKKGVKVGSGLLYTM